MQAKVIHLVDQQSTNQAMRSRVPSKYGGHFVNIQGKVSGLLTAVYPTEQRDHKGSVIWACLCKCGAIAYVPEDRLISNSTRSCGCLKREAERALPTQLHLVDGTCVEWIEKRKHRSDNTSGFRGVYKIRDDRFRVGIGFKGKRHHIGYFSTIDEAVQARLDAEEKMYVPFLLEYYAGVNSENDK